MLKNLLDKRLYHRKSITKLHAKEAEERAECQAEKKAWEEQYSCMDSKQLPPGFIGAQLLPHAPPSQPCSSIDNNLLRLPAGF